MNKHRDFLTPKPSVRNSRIRSFAVLKFDSNETLRQIDIGHLEGVSCVCGMDDACTGVAARRRSRWAVGSHVGWFSARFYLCVSPEFHVPTGDRRRAELGMLTQALRRLSFAVATAVRCMIHIVRRCARWPRERAVRWAISSQVHRISGRPAAWSKPPGRSYIRV